MVSGGNVELMTGVFTPSRRGRPLAKGSHGGVYINLAYLICALSAPLLSLSWSGRQHLTMRFIGSPPASAFEIVSPTYTAINLYDSIAEYNLSIHEEQKTAPELVCRIAENWIIIIR